MPVTGLSKTLENMLMSVMQSHELKNWSIFEDNGIVSFKIRFNIVECQGQESHQPGSYTAFRRKSEKQIDRDRQRALKRQRKQSSENSPETERLNCFDSFHKPEISPVNIHVAESLDISTPNALHKEFVPLSYGIDELDEFCDIDAKLPLEDMKPTDAVPKIFKEEEEESEDAVTTDENEERIAKEFYKLYKCFRHLPQDVKNFGHFYRCFAEYIENNEGCYECFDPTVFTIVDSDSDKGS